MLPVQSSLVNAIRDLLLTVTWALVVSTTGVVASFLTPYLGDNERLGLGLVLAITGVQVALFNNLSGALNGASMNPLINLANLSAAVGNESWRDLILRFPLQLAGMFLGIHLAFLLTPSHLEHTLQGPALAADVTIAVAATAELILAFGLFTICTWAAFAGPTDENSKSLILTSAPVVAVAVGMQFTGPSINPFFAFAWAYRRGFADPLEHFLVYWLAPLLGATLSGLTYHFLLKPGHASTTKLKKT